MSSWSTYNARLARRDGEDPSSGPILDTTSVPHLQDDASHLVGLKNPLSHHFSSLSLFVESSRSLRQAWCRRAQWGLQRQLPGELAPYWGKFPRLYVESTMRASTSTTISTITRGDWLSQETISRGTPQAWPSACQHRREPGPSSKVPLAQVPKLLEASSQEIQQRAALGRQYCEGPQPSSSPSMCISSMQTATCSYCRGRVPSFGRRRTQTCRTSRRLSGNGQLPHHDRSKA